MSSICSRCTECGGKFVPFSVHSVVCGPECGRKRLRLARERAECLSLICVVCNAPLVHTVGKGKRPPRSCSKACTAQLARHARAFRKARPWRELSSFLSAVSALRVLPRLALSSREGHRVPRRRHYREAYRVFRGVAALRAADGAGHAPATGPDYEGRGGGDALALRGPSS